MCIRDSLLGGLEEQPHPAAELTDGVQSGQRVSRAHEGGGVHVVPAGVGHPGHRRAPGIVGDLLDRERVEVGAQADGPLPRAEVGDEPGGAQPLQPPPDGLQVPGDHVGGAVLGPGQLGVGVEVAPQADQLGLVVGHDLRDEGGGGQGAR